MEFEERVHQLMVQYGLNQKELSQLSHITEASMSKYLSGQRTPRVDVIVNLAKALDTTTDDLLGCMPQDTQEEFKKTKAFLARSKEGLTEQQKKELLKILLED
jgi:transcriptional regulator with XRE-family HTH domain